MLTAYIPCNEGFATPVLDIVSLAHLRLSRSEQAGFRVWCIAEGFAEPDLESLFDINNPTRSEFRRVVDYEGVALIISNKSNDLEIHVVRTLHATIPIYICVNDTEVIVSWDYLCCAQSVQFSINATACRRFILQGQTLAADTIIAGVKLLAGGTIASFAHGGLTIHYTDTVPRFEASTLVPDAEAACAFIDLIADEIRLRMTHAAVPALELSGGLDSSCIAGAVARLDRAEVQTYGLIHDGVAGVQQALRRAELASRFSLLDVTRPSSSCAPFASFSSSDANVRKVPCDEIFRSGIEACLAALVIKPDIVITGIGGDELTLLPAAPAESRAEDVEKALFGECLPDVLEPSTLPIRSAVESAFCRADLFLSRGIWPLNPLLSARVVHFCQQLPHAIKQSRLLNKIALAKLGMSDFFLFPTYRENFGSVFDEALRRFDIQSYFETAMIHELGIVRLPQLISAHAGFVNYGECAISRICFTNSVRLEHTLRLLVGSR